MNKETTRPGPAPNADGHRGAERPGPARPPLVLAGHGTRDPEGTAAALALAERVGRLLPGVRVVTGFIELAAPGVGEALADVLADGADAAVVVPLVIGEGAHVRDDLPAALDAARITFHRARVVLAGHLGAPASLAAAARRRVDAARQAWPPASLTVVSVGRGWSDPEANGDQARLGRILRETGGYAEVLTAFSQVTRPTPTDALTAAHRLGARRIVVMPHQLFPGVLTSRVREQVAEWQAAHPATEVRVAEPIGDCPELAELVVARYREAVRRSGAAPGSPAYLTGLLLAGRTVVVVGGGRVNRRRVPKLLAAGAEVVLVSPELHPDLAALARSGAISWRARGFVESDLDGAWYVLAATDDPETNARVAGAAEARRLFCVRADRADLGSAWTPATGEVAGVSVAAVTSHDPLRARRVRDRLLELIVEEGL